MIQPIDCRFLAYEQPFVVDSRKRLLSRKTVDDDVKRQLDNVRCPSFAHYFLMQVVKSLAALWFTAYFVSEGSNSEGSRCGCEHSHRQTSWFIMHESVLHISQSEYHNGFYLFIYRYLRMNCCLLGSIVERRVRLRQWSGFLTEVPILYHFVNLIFFLLFINSHFVKVCNIN